MASRMDRYSKKEFTSTESGRSERNKSLYKQIEDLDSYTNIAGIATIENKNSIDIEKVRELLKSRESKHQDKNEKKIEEVKEEPVDEIRNYDIKELLSKAKEKEQESGKKYRSLSSKQQKMLKELNQKNKKSKHSKDIDGEDINELMKTISNMKVISDESDPDDVGLFDDLKSDTMVGDASSIKKIIDEEKELTREFDEMQIDKSFYTASLGFTQRDFEDLKEMNHKIKKDNKFIIILLIILILLLIGGAVFFLTK